MFRARVIPVAFGAVIALTSVVSSLTPAAPKRLS